jgi:hypothetical protein
VTARLEIRNGLTVLDAIAIGLLLASAGYDRSPLGRLVHVAPSVEPENF